MNIFGLKVGEGAELDAAIAEGAEAEATKGKIYGKLEKAHATLNALNRELGAAAYKAESTGDRASYEKLEADITKAQRDVELLNQALQAADEKIGGAIAHVNAAKHRERVKTTRRILARRKRSVSDLQAALATLAYAYPEIYETNSELVQVFDPLKQPEGVMLTANEVEYAASFELLRLTRPDPIRGPFIPGAARELLTNPSEITPLLETLEQCDNAILKALEPDAAPVKSYGSGAMAERDPATITDAEFLEGLARVIDPDDALLQPTTGPVSAAQVMATMGPAKQVLIDNRVNKGDGNEQSA